MKNTDGENTDGAIEKAKQKPADKGSHHWWLQRISALLLIPLTLWFMFAILDHIGDAHWLATAWIARPEVAAALIAYLVFLFFHAQLGLQVIIEDYVANHGARRKTLLALQAVNWLGAAVAIYSVLRIAFW